MWYLRRSSNLIWFGKFAWGTGEKLKTVCKVSQEDKDEAGWRNGTSLFIASHSQWFLPSSGYYRSVSCCSSGKTRSLIQIQCRKKTQSPIKGSYCAWAKSTGLNLSHIGTHSSRIGLATLAKKSGVVPEKSMRLGVTIHDVGYFGPARGTSTNTESFT